MLLCRFFFETQQKQGHLQKERRPKWPASLQRLGFSEVCRSLRGRLGSVDIPSQHLLHLCETGLHGSSLVFPCHRTGRRGCMFVLCVHATRRLFNICLCFHATGRLRVCCFSAGAVCFWGLLPSVHGVKSECPAVGLELGDLKRFFAQVLWIGLGDLNPCFLRASGKPSHP